MPKIADHRWNSWVVVVFCLVMGGIVGALLLLGVLSTGSMFSFAYWAEPAISGTQVSSLPDKSTILRNVSLTFAGIITLFFGFFSLIFLGWRSLNTHRQTDIAQKGQYAERFQKAASMLGEERLSVREAGIFALTEVAKADPDTYYLPVQKLLCAFIRDKSAEQRREEDKGKVEGRILSDDPSEEYVIYRALPSSDVVEAFKAFTSLRNTDLEGEWKPDLSRSNLSRISSEGANLQSIDFKSAYMFGMDLASANLHKATFVCANLNRAVVRSADLKGAMFVCTKMGEADFKEAKLEGTSFFGSDFTGSEVTTEQKAFFSYDQWQTMEVVDQKPEYMPL
ncbi:pentapeptide repeat-containing protein [Flexibacterium corallicola]|uniref:pentapeptide repeat-containing protein n=1 Tax=Flexibacterium corallicola TaxID=3037259 RepID=UPI00286EEFB1|nr:pentapeptide repeat-containing protein [Pseudovibrio sp. M1P-2-3]